MPLLNDIVIVRSISIGTVSFISGTKIDAHVSSVVNHHHSKRWFLSAQSMNDNKCPISSTLLLHEWRTNTMWLIYQNRNSNRNNVCDCLWQYVGKMKSRFSEFDFEALNIMYEKEKQRLTDALLNGSSWEEVQDQRRLVTTLAIERHKKWKLINPAENEIRRDPHI